MSDFFQGIAPVKFKGPATADPLAFRYYQPERLVMGKRMDEHLRHVRRRISGPRGNDLPKIGIE